MEGKINTTKTGSGFGRNGAGVMHQPLTVEKKIAFVCSCCAEFTIVSCLLIAFVCWFLRSQHWL